jgi:hypothetical protein
MKRSLSIVLCWALLCLYPFKSVLSQSVYREGFIVKTSGDTLKGLVKISDKQNPSAGCYYKSFRTSSEVLYRADEINGFTINDLRSYKVIGINGQQVIAEALVEGKIDLYSVDKKFYIRDEDAIKQLIVEKIKMEGKLVTDRRMEGKVLEKRIYVGTLKVAMNDCPQLNPKIDATRFTESSLTKMVKDYNACVNSATLSYKDKIPVFRLIIKPIAGISYFKIDGTVSKNGSVTFGFLKDVNFNQTKPTFGAGLELFNPRFTDNLSLGIEARYFQTDAHQIAMTPERTYDYNEVFLKYSAVLVPITFGYRIDLNSTVSLNFRGGFLKTFPVESKFKTIQRQTKYPAVADKEESRFEFYKSPTGYSVGIGLQKKRFTFETRLDSVGPLINSVHVGFITTAYSGLVSWSF